MKIPESKGVMTRWAASDGLASEQSSITLSLVM